MYTCNGPSLRVCNVLKDSVGKFSIGILLGPFGMGFRIPSFPVWFECNGHFVFRIIYRGPVRLAYYVILVNCRSGFFEVPFNDV